MWIYLERQPVHVVETGIFDLRLVVKPGDTVGYTKWYGQTFKKEGTVIKVYRKFLVISDGNGREEHCDWDNVTKHNGTEMDGILYRRLLAYDTLNYCKNNEGFVRGDKKKGSSAGI